MIDPFDVLSMGWNFTAQAIRLFRFTSTTVWKPAYLELAFTRL